MTAGPARRLAFVCSANGGLVDALAAAHAARATPARPVCVVTDRACGAEAVAARHGIASVRSADVRPDALGRCAADAARAHGADVVILLCTRAVGAPLWRDADVPVLNLHPSLLPAHAGLDGLRRSWDAAAHDPHAWLGVTMHHAHAALDAGPVVGQIRFRVTDARTRDGAAHLAFLAKLALVLAYAEATAPPPATPQSALADLPWQGHARGLVPSDAVSRALAPFIRPGVRPCFGSPEVALP